MEGILKFYYDGLFETNDPALHLSKLYCELFDYSLSTTLMTTFKKLIKLYGRNLVFFAIVETLSVQDFDNRNPYGILNYFCKKLLNLSTPTIPKISTDDLRERLKKRPPKNIPDPWS